MINGSRRKRIANGAGRDVAELNRLLKQYQALKDMMQKMRKGKMGKMLGKFPPLPT